MGSTGSGKPRVPLNPSGFMISYVDLNSGWDASQTQIMDYSLGPSCTLALMRSDVEEAKEAGSMAEADELWKVGAYVCILTAASLRGHEGFYLDLAGLCKHLAKGRLGVIPPGLSKSSPLTEEMCRDLLHVTICLLGKFKGESGTDHHMICVANDTISGLHPRW